MSNDKEITTEGVVLLNALESEREKISEIMSELDNKLKSLANTNAMIQSVPKKLTEKLESNVPKVVSELKSALTEELNIVKHSYTEDIKQHHQFLQDYENRIQQLAHNMLKIEKRKVMRFFLGIIISSIIAVGCATYAASYMMQTFPTRVTINKPENIILYDSEVSLWGTDNVKVFKGLRKNDRKNKNKF